MPLETACSFTNQMCLCVRELRSIWYNYVYKFQLVTESVLTFVLHSVLIKLIIYKLDPIENACR